MTLYNQVHKTTFDHYYTEAYRVNSLMRASCTAPAEIYNYQGKCYLSHDKNSGYMIKDDGDLVLVFSMVKGRGDTIVRHAVKNGAIKLDCFDGYLVDLYSGHGFVVHKREPNWTDGEPDVVYMYHVDNVVNACLKSMYY